MRWVSCAAAAMFVLGGASVAHAGSMTFSGTGTSIDSDAKIILSASALFNITGSTLTITLKNTGDGSGAFGADLPGNALTGVFFSLPTGVELVPVSATVAKGAIVSPGKCNKGVDCVNATNVGGEVAYNPKANWDTSDGPAPALANHGVASSGYIGSTQGNFNGSNLAGPPNPNGPDFGIIAKISDANKFNPNGGLENVPLIEEQIVYTMTIKKNGSVYDGLLDTQISNVTFQYGTGFNQSRLPGSFTPSSTPEPAALLLLVPAAAALARRRLRSR